MNTSKKIVTVVVLILIVVATGGYFLWQRSSAGHTHQEGEKAAQGPVQYTCPMHPFILKDKPGSCPICGMTLVKKVEAAEAGQKEMEALGQISLSPTQQVIANVATTEAKLMPLDREISAVGIVAYDQARQAKVTAWVAGRIDRLNVSRVGDYVSTKHPVAELYSPELVSSQQEYLLALKSREQLKNSPISAISQGGEGLVNSARQRLKLYGVKDSQIAALEKAGQPNIRIPIYTPLSGVVIDKIVQQGQYVNMGDPLFSIADLSTVWVEVEVYENEFPSLKVGQKVEITSQSYPGKTFHGRVALIYPFLDPKTRTVKARVEISNPGLKLKPDMFVNASLKVPLGQSLVVPVAAVMDTGKRKVVWVEMEPGKYMPHDVTVGVRVNDNLQILSGLKAGDRVVSSGGYLIDSEAQLKGGGGQDHSKHTGGAPGAAPAGAPQKKNDGMSMDDMKM